MSATIDRKRFVAASASALASVAFLRRPAGAAEFNLKYASAQQADNPVTLAMNAAAEKIKTESNGRIALSIFPNSILGGDTAMLTQLRSGAINFLTFLDGGLATVVPLSAISNVGFAFKDYSEVFAAMDGSLGALVRADIAKAGIHVFDHVWDNGFRQITSSKKPVEMPDDLNGLKIRVPTSPIELSLFRALGASPTALAFSEVYSALQTHLVDAQENPLTIIENGKVFEVQKYLSLTSHVWTGFWFLANTDLWAGLPKDVREIVERNIEGAVAGQRKASESANTALLAKLKAQGMLINAPERAPFKRKLERAGYYKEWRGRLGETAWKTLERTTGVLG
jgi:tripartite ATP-independent transporter DctP family solute receptor